MKINIQFKNPDQIHEIINARHPLPDDEDDITPRMEKERDDFSSEYFEYGDYGVIEVDTNTLRARLLPKAQWAGSSDATDPGLMEGYSGDFGYALTMIKAGHRVARAGWNGKGMWIALSGSTTNPRNIAWENFWSKNASEWARDENGGGAEVLPCILMKTADNRILMGWLASQSDMLADDWMLVSC